MGKRRTAANRNLEGGSGVSPANRALRRAFAGSGKQRRRERKKTGGKERQKFQKVWSPLLEFVCRERTGNPRAKLYGGDGMDIGVLQATADYMYENRDVISRCLAENRVAESTRRILLSWQAHARSGGGILLGTDGEDALWMTEENRIFRVRSLMGNWETMFRGQTYPLQIRGAILPFHDTLIPDGLIQAFPSWNPAVRDNPMRILEEAKADGTILSTFPWMQMESDPAAKEAKPMARKGLKMKKKNRKKR